LTATHPGRERARGPSVSIVGGRETLATWIWLIFLGAVCLAETLTHAGSHNGFLESSRPLYSQFSGRPLLPADGYLTWIGQVPALQDAESFVKQAAFFLGQQGPQDTGFLDRRAAYAYFAALLLPWFPWEGGAYGAFVAVNALFWWGAAAAMFWLVRRRWRDTALALGASFLVATGNGLIFMVGLPQSYVPAYAVLVLLLALAEWLDVWRPPHRVGPWLILGWAAGVASTIYFTHIPIAVFWWVYGARRVPWRYLCVATALAFGIGTLWEVYGHQVAGLAFVTDNSALVGTAARRWQQHLLTSWSDLIAYVRSANTAGVVLGAFPVVWWPLVGAGLLASRRADREWAVAGILAGLVPAVAMIALLSLPRIAYFMFPAVYILAAQGVLCLAGLAGAWLARRGLPAPATGRLTAALAVLLLALLALTGNADLFGYQGWNAQFHHSAVIGGGAG
jgi:hypothetical protein